MRSAIYLLRAGMALALLSIPAIPGESVEMPLSPGSIQLELPELGDQRYAPGILRVPEPQQLRRVLLHIPLSRVHQAFPKINAIGTGLVQTMRARQGEVICDIDFSLHQGRFYAFNAADNTIEVKVVPAKGAEPLYAQWVIAPPKEPQAWQTQRRAGSLAGAELGREGLVVLQEEEDGRLTPLDKGVTTAKRIFLQARFPQREESVSLRIHWIGAEGGERTFSVGSWRSEPAAKGRQGAARPPQTLEGDVDLGLGLNRLEVDVMHGTTSLSRASYKIVRRALSTPTAVTGEKWAVVVGISDYRAEGLDLRYADRDAEALRDFLVNQGGFRAERVQLLRNQEATYQGIRTALFGFLAATQPEDLVLIFLAGHGVQDSVNPDNFFFLAHDSDPANLGGTAIPMWDLGNVMDYTIRSQRILVFADTCHSGAALDRGGPRQEAGLNFFNKYLEVLARKKGRLVLTASQAHETSQERTSLAHGVFTHSVLLGLAGGADDRPADGVVTAGELVDYVRGEVPEETEGEQHPSVGEEGFDLNLPLAYVRPARPAKR